MSTIFSLFSIALLLTATSANAVAPLPESNSGNRCQASYNPINQVVTLPCFRSLSRANQTSYSRVEMKLDPPAPPFRLHTLSNNTTTTPDPADRECIARYDEASGKLVMPCLRIRGDKSNSNFYIGLRQLPDNAVGFFRFLVTEIKPAPAPTRHQQARVLLLLHGMSSDEHTWNDYVRLETAFDSCATIALGVVTGRASLPRAQPPAIGCFRLRFGAYDGFSGRTGLEHIRAHGPRSGDFSTFNTLGKEVGDAIQAIKRLYQTTYGPLDLKIALVAHSRGGLAARAFLQDANASEKSGIVALLTTGTPHRGSPLGRIYRYLQDNCLDSSGFRKDDRFFGIATTACDNDWQVVDFLRARKNCIADTFKQFIDFFTSSGDPEKLDVRRPTIDDLSDYSEPIQRLLDERNSLPTDIEYAALRYTGIELGKLDKEYRIFDLAGLDPCDQVSRRAQNYLLYPTYSNQGENLGDGIVPFGSQALPAGNVTEYARGELGAKLHIEEPKPLTGQQAHISYMLEHLLKWGFRQR